MKTKLLLLILAILSTISSFSQIDEMSFDGSMQFANAVATDGDWAVVGNKIQTGHLMGSEYPNAGRISIYKKEANGNWFHFQDIDEPGYFAYENDPNQNIGMFYGCDVDISGQYIIVGAHAYDSDMQGDIGPDGMAFIYKYDEVDEIWETVATLAPEVAVENSFGWSVAISGNTAVVGDPSERHSINGEAFDRDNIGAAYVYHKVNGDWELDTKLTAQNGWGSAPGIAEGPGDLFGYDVDIDLNSIVVGAPSRGAENGPEQQHGSVYVYTKNAGFWNEIMLDDSEANNYSSFGAAVSISGDLVVAGAPHSSEIAYHAGEIVVYEDQFGIWEMTNHFASDASASDNFGWDVDINSNGIIAIGANGFDSKGKVYFFDFDDNMNEASLQSLNIEPGDEFGYAVSLSEDNLVVGAWKTYRGDIFRNGSVYFYNFSEDVFEGNWTGAVSSDWYDPLNWSDNNVPNSLTDVYIPQAVPNYPVINVVTALSRNLEIEAGATLTIGTGYLNAMGDVNNHGQIYNEDILHFYVHGNTIFDGAGQQDVPAGEFNGEFHYDCGDNSDIQGDIRLMSGWDHDNNKRLNIGANIFEIRGLIWGTDRKLIFDETSSLYVYGEPVAAFTIPENIWQLNDLQVNVTNNEDVYINGYITVNGVLSLLDGDVYLGFDSDAQLTLFNPIVMEDGQLLPHPFGGNSSIIIMDNGKDNDEFYIPASLDELSSFWVSRSQPTLLLGDLLVTDLYALYTAAFDVNGFDVVLGPDADMWIGGDAQITQDMIGEDGIIDDIQIESGSPTFDFDAEVDGDFSIGAGAGQVNIAAGRCITVNGTTTIDANLVLRADADGAACFIDNGPIDYSSKADASIIVESYIPSKEEWHYISSPVKDATAEFFAGCFLNSYDPDQEKWIPFSSLNQSLNTMQGYSAKLPAAFNGQKLEFSGELNTAHSSALSIDLSNGGDAYNLVGNPFPSTIDWDNANWTKTNLANAIYIWNPGTGSYTSYVNGGGVNGGSNLIPAMQGFFVEATGANPSLQIDNNDVRVTTEAAFLKSEESVSDQLKIQLFNENEIDEVMVRFIEGSTPALDHEFDAWKLFGRSSLAQLFIENENDEKQAIQTLSSVKETDFVQLGLQIEEAGTYELRMDLQNSFSEYVNITLEDKKLNEFISVHGALSYEFNYDSEAEAERFVIHFKDYTSLDELNEQEVNIYYSNHQLYIQNSSEQSYEEISIYNLAGQLLMTEEMDQQQIQSVDASLLSSGSYIVQLRGENASVNRKIIINQ